MTRTMDRFRAGHLLVRRHAHWVEAGAGPGQPAELWIVLHGYGQRAARFLRRFRGIAGDDRRVVAPEGLSRYYLDEDYRRVGASWMTREDRIHEIEDTVHWLDTLVEHLHARDGAPPRTVVLGFSQGAPTAGRWLVRGRSRADALICWGAGLPHDVEAEKLRRLGDATAITLVAGEEDEVVPPDRVRTEHLRLEEAGVRHRLRHHPGGHEIDTALLATLTRHD